VAKGESCRQPRTRHSRQPLRWPRRGEPLSVSGGQPLSIASGLGCPGSTTDGRGCASAAPSTQRTAGLAGGRGGAAFRLVRGSATAGSHILCPLLCPLQRAGASAYTTPEHTCACSARAAGVPGPQGPAAGGGVNFARARSRLARRPSARLAVGGGVSAGIETEATASGTAGSCIEPWKQPHTRAAATVPMSRACWAHDSRDRVRSGSQSAGARSARAEDTEGAGAIGGPIASHPRSVEAVPRR
jgi:hypothetical protein